MAIDTHIKFDGIDGESTSKDHKGEIDVLSWSWGLTNDRAGSGKGSGAGKPKAEDFRIVHRYDKASPVLARHAAKGTAIPTAVLSARKAGQGQKDFLKITMKEVFITSVQVGAAAEGADAVEEVAFRYQSFDVSYRPTDQKGGLGGAVTMSWDLKKNKVT
jgi:type VI secretion system secreted protein Hcp